MTQERLTPGAQFFTVLFALVLAVNVLGFGLLAALSKSAIAYNMNATHLLPSAVSPGDSIADITLLNNASERVAFKGIAIETRNFVMGKPVSLPRDQSNLRGFSEKVMSHLREVRTVISAALYATFVASALAFIGLIICMSKNRMRVFFSACLSAGISMLVVFGAFGVAVAINFSGLFENFHRIFFAEGTWVFAADSLLIRTFPLQFWMQEAVVWAVFSVLTAIIYLLLGAIGRKCVAQAGFSVN